MLDQTTCKHDFEPFPKGDLNWRRCRLCGVLARKEFGRLVIKRVVTRG